MATGTIKHRYQSAVPDEGVSSEVGPVEWNDSMVVAGGVDGQYMVRRTSVSDGWELIYGGAPLTFINATQAANSGTGETDLHAFTLDAAYFNANKRKIRVTLEGSFAANANVKTLRLKLGAAGVITLNPTTASPNGKRFKAVVTITRTGSNVQRLLAETLLDGSVEKVAIATAAETDSGALVVKVTGQSGTGSNDILLDETMIEFLN